MKRILTLAICLAFSAVMMAIPAKRGIKKTLTLANGNTVEATLVGDEHAHFWRAADGTNYQRQGKFFAPVELKQLQQKALQRRNLTAKRRQAPLAPTRRKSAMTGNKKGIIILVEYTDVKFQKGHSKAKYLDIANKEGYTSSEGFSGSVHDYFSDQSNGQFNLTFDVVGPVQLDSAQAYYGGNDADGNDMHAEAMIREACIAAADSVDFSDYDWDGDGYVDQVFVLYAGKGEADGGEDETVWPHEYQLSYSNGGPLNLDGVTIDTYACSNEIAGYRGSIEGIGTIVHEFSHCLGYPDMYDTSYSGYEGTGSYDVMCMGSYNGNSFIPAGYTAYEKMIAGWTIPVELTDSLQVDSMKPMSQHGQSYIIYNKGHKDEYYLIENRQKEKWDIDIPGAGLMVSHIDYDANLWAMNNVNSCINYSDTYGSYYSKYDSDHERVVWVRADNDDDQDYYYASYGGYWKTTEETDPYPYGDLDSLNTTSKPATMLYNKNSNGKKFLTVGLYNITQNADGTMSFNARPLISNTNTGDYLFHETFDQIEKEGGNDGKWNGTAARSAMSEAYEDLFDMQGWTYSRAFLANQCVKVASSSATGYMTTPAITVDGDYTLTFRAGAWKYEKKADTPVLQLRLETTDSVTIDKTSFNLTQGEWGTYTAKISGKGTFKLTFTSTPSSSAEHRFFLDDVAIPNKPTTGIVAVESKVAHKVDNRIYNINGQFMGTDLRALPRGLYIVGGKKIMK